MPDRKTKEQKIIQWWLDNPGKNFTVSAMAKKTETATSYIRYIMAKLTRHGWTFHGYRIRKAYPPGTENTPSPRPTAGERVRIWLNDEYTEGHPIHISSKARELGVTPQTLRNNLKKAIGWSPTYGKGPTTHWRMYKT